MKAVVHRLHWAHLIIFLSVLLAIGLRTYKWNELTVFNGDDGMDLSIVWNMEYRNHRPFVGPFLSIPDFYTPPTYYYLTWMFYRINPSPDGVRMGYFLMDIVNMTIIVTLAYLMGNRNAAAITGLLYATSQTLIYHGRAYWQPFPMQLFLSLMLLFFWLAYTKKSMLLLGSAAISYIIALSVYPSPVVLLPFVLYHLTNWFRQIKHLPLFPALGRAGIMLACTTACIYYPQFVYEYRHGFPTLHTLLNIQSAPFMPRQFFHALFSYIGISVTNLIRTPGILPRHYWGLLPAGYILLLIYTHRMSAHRESLGSKTTMTLSIFFPPLILFIGYLFTRFIPDFAPQRVWAFIPIFILLSSIIIEKALRSKPKAIMAAGILLLVYLSGNISGYKNFTQSSVNAIGLTRSIAQAITEDMENSKIPQEKTTLVYIIADNPSEHYQLNRILYWLIASGSFHIPLAADGNKLDYDIYQPASLQPTVYLLCEKFATPEKTSQDCLAPFMETNRSYVPALRMDNAELSLITLKKRDGRN